MAAITAVPATRLTGFARPTVTAPVPLITMGAPLIAPTPIMVFATIGAAGIVGTGGAEPLTLRH